jgi:hypothetical protein
MLQTRHGQERANCSSQNYQRDYKDLPGTFEDATDPAFTARTRADRTTRPR